MFRNYFKLPKPLLENMKEKNFSCRPQKVVKKLVMILLNKKCDHMIMIPLENLTAIFTEFWCN